MVTSTFDLGISILRGGNVDVQAVSHLLLFIIKAFCKFDLFQKEQLLKLL